MKMKHLKKIKMVKSNELIMQQVSRVLFDEKERWISISSAARKQTSSH